jgi:hypothetical protein
MSRAGDLRSILLTERTGFLACDNGCAVFYSTLYNVRMKGAFIDSLTEGLGH